MLVDLHVHTSRYSPCSPATPQEMVESALARGLNGLVITEHDYLWGEAELAELQSCYPGIKLFRGMEVSITLDEHMLVIGVSDPTPFKLCMSAHRLREAVREQGGVCILAHPCRWAETVHPDILAAGFDAVEGYSINVSNYMRGAVDQLARMKKVPIVANTDSHVPDTLGLYGIRLDNFAATEQELARAIRLGQFRIFGHKGRLDERNREQLSKLEHYQSLKTRRLSTEEAMTRAGLSLWQKYGVKRGLDIGLAIP